MAKPVYPNQMRRKINSTHLKLLLQHGWNDADICKFFDISKRTYERWRNKYRHFREEVDYWRSAAVKLVEKRGLEAAAGYQHPEEKIFISQEKIYDKEGRVIKEVPKVIRVQTTKIYPPNPALNIFHLCNRKPEEYSRTGVPPEHDPGKNLPKQVYNIVNNYQSGGKKALTCEKETLPDKVIDRLTFRDARETETEDAETNAETTPTQGLEIVK